MIACIITGAGNSTRFKSHNSKQYAKIKDKTVFEKTIDAFKNEVDFIICTIKKEDEKLFTFNVPYVFGGESRQASVFNALSFLNQLNEKPQYVLIADGARPCVSKNLIAKIKEKLQEGKRAVLPAIKSTDTVRRVHNGKVELLNRDEVFFAQTPQGFEFELIFRLHSKYQDMQLTDDIALCEQEGDVEITIVEGEKSNIKITYSEDMQYI